MCPGLLLFWVTCSHEDHLCRHDDECHGAACTRRPHDARGRDMRRGGMLIRACQAGVSTVTFIRSLRHRDQCRAENLRFWNICRIKFRFQFVKNLIIIDCDGSESLHDITPANSSGVQDDDQWDLWCSHHPLRGSQPESSESNDTRLRVEGEHWHRGALSLNTEHLRCGVWGMGWQWGAQDCQDTTHTDHLQPAWTCELARPMYGIVPRLPEIRRPGVLCSAQHRRWTHSRVHWLGWLAGPPGRERGRKLRRCGHAVSCYLLLPRYLRPGINARPEQGESAITKLINDSFGIYSRCTAPHHQLIQFQVYVLFMGNWPAGEFS